MAKRGSHLNAHKVTPKPKLAAIIGKKPVSYAQAMKKLHKDIADLGLKGELGDGYKVKFKGKSGKTVTNTGGQIIHCGEDPAWKAFCGGKQRVSMLQLAGFVKKHSTPPK
tara:strand:+ start:151 stop:480 length:330 start_codon:yes stop_codon:yes gene_type:complete